MWQLTAADTSNPVPSAVNHFAPKASTVDGDIWEKKSIDTQYYQPMVWNSALFIDSSSFTSPDKWNHRVSFASNDFGIVIWLDFIETLKIRLKASQTWLFDSASTLSPHFNNSPNSWIDLTAFPAILPCFTCGRVSRRKFVRFEKSAKVFKTEKGACNSRYFFSRLANCACLL